MGILTASATFGPIVARSCGQWLKWVCFVFLLCLLGAPGQASAQPDNIERQVKAAYLYKFASYVEWPGAAFADAGSPLVIGVIGADALAGELDQIVAGHTVHGRPVVTRKLKRGDKLSDLHILFIGRLDKVHLLELLSEAKRHPLLTVSESEETHALGSMINFVITGDRIRFQVALEPVGAARLKISARMLTAAYKIVPGSS